MKKLTEENKKEFLQEFSEGTEEIVVKVRWAWEKECSAFQTYGKEERAKIQCLSPKNIENPGNPIGAVGTVYWFSRKKLFG